MQCVHRLVLLLIENSIIIETFQTQNSQIITSRYRFYGNLGSGVGICPSQALSARIIYDNGQSNYQLIREFQFICRIVQLPDGAPGIGIAFSFVDRVAIGQKGFVHLADRGVTPAQQIETLARFRLGFDGLLQILDGQRLALVALAQRIETVQQPTFFTDRQKNSTVTKLLFFGIDLIALFHLIGGRRRPARRRPDRSPATAVRTALWRSGCDWSLRTGGRCGSEL